MAPARCNPGGLTAGRLAVGALAAAWAISRDGLLILLALVAVGQAAAGKSPERGDTRTIVEYALLALVLAGMLLLPVPVSP